MKACLDACQSVGASFQINKNNSIKIAFQIHSLSDFEQTFPKVSAKTGIVAIGIFP